MYRQDIIDESLTTWTRRWSLLWIWVWLIEWGWWSDPHVSAQFCWTCWNQNLTGLAWMLKKAQLWTHWPRPIGDYLSPLAVPNWFQFLYVCSSYHSHILLSSIIGEKNPPCLIHFMFGVFAYKSALSSSKKPSFITYEQLNRNHVLLIGGKNWDFFIVFIIHWARKQCLSNNLTEYYMLNSKEPRNKGCLISDGRT